jgi:hypothetical protein
LHDYHVQVNHRCPVTCGSCASFLHECQYVKAFWVPLVHWVLTFILVTQLAGVSQKRLKKVSLGREWAAINIATCQEPRYKTHPSISAYRKLVRRRPKSSAEDVVSFTSALRCRRIMARLVCVFPAVLAIWLSHKIESDAKLVPNTVVPNSAAGEEVSSSGALAASMVTSFCVGYFQGWITFFITGFPKFFVKWCKNN